MKKKKNEWSKVVELLKNPYWRAKSRYIKYYEKLPIKERDILLECNHGRLFGCNIFYIAQYLIKDAKYSEYNIYLTCRGRNRKQIQNFLNVRGYERIRLVVLASDEYYRVVASAKYLINNTTFLPFFIKKTGQIYLNTWHGTPFKRLGKKVNNDFLNIGNVQKNFLLADYLLFPNQYTANHIIEDYMLNNLAQNSYIINGYPRNTSFFNENRDGIREAQQIQNKYIYAYMPTFRGVHKDGGTSKNNVYLQYFFYELEKKLQENEVFYVNLHPAAQKIIKWKEFNKIKPFPNNYETYEFLNVADALVTDYSSVFFDFALTQKKIILFPYDKEDYLKDRGLYFDFNELPFPQVFSVEDLLKELRSTKQYDDTDFLREFCNSDHINATQQLCDQIILDIPKNLKINKIPNNGKENVYIYAGNLATNGITTSLRNLLSTIDTQKRNYYISFIPEKSSKNKDNLISYFPDINYYPISNDSNVTIFDRIIRKLFKKNILSCSVYLKLQKKRLEQDFFKNFGSNTFSHVIHFNGYETDIILLLSMFKKNKIIFIHNDMLQEISTKGNQRKDVLEYAYNSYSTVAIVTEDLMKNTIQISRQKHNIKIVKNIINYKLIKSMSQMPIEFNSVTKISIDQDKVIEIMNSDKVKFINIGRYSKEKGHYRLINAFKKALDQHNDMYLIIVGGYSLQDEYNSLKNYIVNFNLQERVILIQNISNPYPILNKCDYFVLSSFYEGFGLVLAEADILGKPVVSTDIVGPKNFMEQNGGTLVENSEEGIYQGIKMLLQGQVSVMGVDYELYNQEAIQQFESLFES